VFAFDACGPLSIRPHAGAAWTPKGHPDRLPANYHKRHGVRQFHGCYSVGDDTMWGVVHRGKSVANTLAALKSIRAARPDGAPIYIVWDNLSAHKGATIRVWAARNRVELCFTPTYASWANPTEARFGPLRTFAIAGSNHPNHTVLTQRPPPRRPRRPTPRTRPHPLRTPSPLGPTRHPTSGLTPHRQRLRSEH
jgi:hypothetical protein